jgi:glyoxylase-like metal-dependent hydrolase (beta-lactamase superfamily II)
MKKALLIILALTAIGVGALMYTFTAAKLEFTPLVADALPAASPPAEMTISAMPSGSMESRALFAFRGGSISDKRDFTMTAILVHHPKGDLLFDTGFGRNVDEHAKTIPWLMRQLASYSKSRSVGDQLESNGYPPAKLAGVVLTHAHWDHISGLDSLPGVPVWVDVAERNFIFDKTSMTGLINSFENVNYKEYGFGGGPYLGFPSSFDVWGDGSVVIVPAPGHTPGSIVAFITLPTGTRYALLGDLVWQIEGIEIPAERPWLSRRLVQEEDAQVRENIVRVAAIHKRFPEIHLIPAHDARSYANLPVYPAEAR